jgi:dihydroorotase
MEKMDKMKGNAYVDYGFHFGGKKTDNSSEVSKITKICASTKIFLNVSTGDMLVEDMGILEQIFKNSKIVAVHAEGEMVERAINLSEKLNIPLYLCHLSTEDELKMLKNAKNKGLKVFGEVTPHHLFLNRENMEETDVTRLLLRMKPELKEKKDNDALWNAIESGLIDSLGTDHAPHTLDEKMTKLTFGVPGVEHSLEMMLSAVKNKKITMLKLIEVMCKNPAEIFKIKNKGDIKVGNHGDLVIVDINDNSPIKNDKIISKSGWTPYKNFNRGGKVLTTILRGNIVYSNGAFFGKYGKEISYSD